MFELANHLVGIYKVFDCTDSVTIVNVVPEMPQTLQPTQEAAPLRPSSILLQTPTVHDLDKSASTQSEAQNKATSEISRLSQQSNISRMSEIVPVAESTRESRNMDCSSDVSQSVTPNTSINNETVFKKPQTPK